MKRILMIIAATMFLNTSVLAAEECVITQIAAGTSRSKVYEKIGVPERGSGNGIKEVYTLSNGGVAVLRFCGNVFDDGFILIN